MEVYDTINERQVQATAPTYWLTRFMILRLLGVLYAIAFLVAINQVLPLIGSNGLTPLAIYLKRVRDALGTDGGFFQLPSIFWFWHSDTALMVVAWLGFLLCIQFISYSSNAFFLYFSIQRICGKVILHSSWSSKAV